MNIVETQQVTLIETEQYIHNLIKKGDVFRAKMALHLINKTNGYEVVSLQRFKLWHVEHLKNQNPQKENQKSNIKSGSFQSEFQKAYMKLISN